MAPKLDHMLIVLTDTGADCIAMNALAEAICK